MWVPERLGEAEGRRPSKPAARALVQTTQPASRDSTSVQAGEGAPSALSLYPPPMGRFCALLHGQVLGDI